MYFCNVFWILKSFLCKFYRFKRKKYIHTYIHMFYFVYVSSVGLSQFGYVLFSWFQLVCFVLFRFVWPSICFTSIFCLLPIHLSCIFLFSFELQLMCHGWHGCGGTWFVLIWFRFCEVVPELVLYPVMSHLVSLSFAEWAFSTTTDRMHYLV